SSLFFPPLLLSSPCSPLFPYTTLFRSWFRFDRSPSSEQSSSLRWLRQCSLALFPKNKFSGPSLCSRGLRCSKNFLFKEIFKGCCLLFSYQGSCRSFFATALIFYQISFALSRSFLFFFFLVCLSRASSNIIPLSHIICQLFFTSFSNLFAITIYGIFT